MISAMPGLGNHDTSAFDKTQNGDLAADASTVADPCSTFSSLGSSDLQTTLNSIEESQRSLPSLETTDNGGNNNLGLSNGSGSSHNETGGTDTSAKESPLTTTTPRPKRAAATVATERMQLRPKTKTPTKNAEPPEEDSESELESPPRKRRQRASDKTFELTKTSIKDIAAASWRKTVASVSPAHKPTPKAAAGPNKLNNLLRKSSARTSEKGDENMKNLCALLRTGESANSVNNVLDSWLDDYKSDHILGYLELANLFIHASGCKGKITYAMKNLSHGEMIKQMTTRFDEDSNEYPLIRSGPEYRKFRLDFCKFIETLIFVIKDSIMFDDYLMDNLIRFLSELADSQVRAFRHTSTLGVMKMLTAMVEAEVELKTVLETDQRQLQVEETKKRPNQPRVQILRRTAEQHAQNFEALKALFDKACKGVFYQRYRDTSTVIRELCIEELGVWMNKFPDRYVDDSYLKYLGWTLNDKEASVRRKCLASILPLYEREDLIPKLHLFSNKFKSRLVQLTSDVDPEVCLRAVKILTEMDRHQQELFGEPDLDRMFELVYAADRAVAVQAAEILLNRMATMANTDPDRKKGRTFTSGKVWSEDVWTIFEIIKFYSESPGNAAHPAYLVDSLIDVCPAMKNWQAMTDLLLHQPKARASESLTEEQEKDLIQIMGWAVKQAALGEGPEGRVAKKAKVRDIQQVQEDITLHFVETLPDLITNFKADERKLSFLISIPQFFDVDIFTTNHKEKELSRLLDLMVEAFEKSDGVDFLKNCTKSLASLEQESSGVFNLVSVKRESVEESVVTTFKENFPQWLAGVSDPEIIYACESSLKRLAALFSVFDLNHFDLWSQLFAIVQRGFQADQVISPAVLKAAISAANFSLIWKMYFFRSCTDSQQPEEGACQTHLERTRLFISTITQVLGSPRNEYPSDTVFACFASLMDLLPLYRPVLDSEPRWQTELELKLSEDEQSAVVDFVDASVFAAVVPANETSKEARELEVHKRRMVLTDFCRAISCGVFAPKFAAPIFKRFIVNTTPEFADILKDAVKRLLEVSKTFAGEAVAAGLIELFTEKLRTRRVQKDSKEMLELKDAAKRFALLFGMDIEKYRSAMGALHKYCFEFIKAAEGDQDLRRRVLFFAVLLEFSTKLTKDDKSRLVRALNALPNLPGTLPNDDLWPFFTYRNTLLAAASLPDQEQEPDKHRRGRRVNPTVPKKAVAKKTVYPEVLEEVESIAESNNADEGASNGAASEIAMEE